MARFADVVDCPVALTNREGTLTTVNARAREFFIGRTGARLRVMVEGAVRRAMGERPRASEAPPNPARQLAIGHERFYVTIVLAGTDVATQDVGAMVMLRREAVHPDTISEHTLAHRFNLTPQEARVAVMLADHLSNREIAARLGVSVHTARHHTERVLAKLEIHSRYDVRKALR